MNQIELSDKLEGLFEDFDFAAREWGWMVDQGYGSMVGEALERYENTKAALIKHLVELERLAGVTNNA